MGHGGARNLEESVAPDRPLDPQLSAKLESALARMDQIDADFKARRDDERFQQQVKTWVGTSKTVDSHLRTMVNLLHSTHQLQLDVGSEGGGQSIKPFLEDLGQRFPRLYFKLDGAEVVAVVENKPQGRCGLDAIDFEFVERSVVEWLLRSVSALHGTTAISG